MTLAAATASVAAALYIVISSSYSSPLDGTAVVETSVERTVSASNGATTLRSAIHDVGKAWMPVHSASDDVTTTWMPVH